MPAPHVRTPTRDVESSTRHHWCGRLKSNPLIALYNWLSRPNAAATYALIRAERFTTESSSRYRILSRAPRAWLSGTKAELTALFLSSRSATNVRSDANFNSFSLGL